METLLINILWAIAIPITAIFAKHLINEYTKDKTKEITIKSNDGKEEVLEVNINSTNIEVINTAKAAASFEEDIGKALNKISSQDERIKVINSKSIDFIIEVDNEKYGVEVKLNINRLKKNYIDRYLSPSMGINHLVFVSKNTVSNKLLDSFESELDNNKIYFVTIPQGSEPLDILRSFFKDIKEN